MSDSAKTATSLEPHEQTARGPVLYLLAGALVWLLVGLVLTCLASLKLHVSGFLPFAWAATGRLQAAANNVLLLGAAAQGGLGIALWLLAHLGKTHLANWGSAVLGTAMWNLALTAGVPALLLGGSTGIPGLELPGSLGLIILVGYLLIGANGVAAIATCKRGGYVPAQWFILGAVLWFAWIYGTSLVTTVFFPGRGVLTALSAGWFTQGSFWLFLAPLALAALHHYLPELTGNPLRSPELVPLAFWSLALFGGWTAAAGLVGGPLPAWVITVSVAAGVLLAIPVLLVAVNLLRPFGSGSTAGRFAQISLLAFVFGGLGKALTSLRCANQVLHFTRFEVALNELLLFGFVFGAFFAAAYALVPKLVGCRLPNCALANAHVALSAWGLVVAVAAYGIGGCKQGWALNFTSADLVSINADLKLLLRLHTAGLAVFLLGQAAFAANLVLLTVSFVLPVGRTLVAEVIGGSAPAPAK
jgi:cytochrome c oxidase cbb3-type subunit 1